MQNYLKPLSALTTKFGYTAIAGILVIMFSAWVLFDATKADVVFAADGEVHHVKTDSDTVGELLEDLGIDVGMYDEISHGENVAIVDGMEIRFQTANNVLVTVDGETEEYHTTAITVGQFLKEEGLDFSRYDDISHSNIEILDQDEEIIVHKAFPVILNNGGEEEEIWATKGTVKELLEKQGIEYDKTDRIEPSLKDSVKEDMEVTVVHIDTEREEVEEKIPFESIEKKDNSLLKGQSEVKTEGKEGKVVKTYKITYENGIEVSRDVVAKDVIEKSQNKVVAIGTKVQKEKKASSTKSVATKKESTSSENRSSNSKTLTMVATAYGPDCSGCSGFSATGMNLKNGPRVIAVDPSVIPLGSRVWVEGYGEAIAADTGGSIKGNRIDVLMKSEAQAANNWGRRTVQVKILN